MRSSRRTTMRAGGRIDPTHEATRDRFLSLLLAKGAILDAACGEGRFWPTFWRTDARSLFAPGCPLMRSWLRLLLFEPPLAHSFQK